MALAQNRPLPPLLDLEAPPTKDLPASVEAFLKHQGPFSRTKRSCLPSMSTLKSRTWRIRPLAWDSTTFCAYMSFLHSKGLLMSYSWLLMPSRLHSQQVLRGGPLGHCQAPALVQVKAAHLAMPSTTNTATSAAAATTTTPTVLDMAGCIWTLTSSRSDPCRRSPTS